MSNFSKTFSSTLGRKLIMSLTGLFLCVFLIVHLIGNFQIFYNDGGLAFNRYAYFMTHFTPIKVVSYLLYASILIHSLYALILTIQNKKARPISYAQKSGNGSVWASRNMGILGTLLLIFIVTHMKTFWFEYHWGATPYVEYQRDLNTNEVSFKEIGVGDFKEYIAYVDRGVEIVKSKDLYKEVNVAFQTEWYVLLYVLCMVALGFHLYHGFQSAFQTLGWNHSKYRPLIRFLGVWVFAVAIPAAFAAMPIFCYFVR